MGFNMGRWVADDPPYRLKYPFELAIKLLSNRKKCTHEEVCSFIEETRKFYDLCKEQDETIRTLEKQLKISEETVRLLQVDNR